MSASKPLDRKCKEMAISHMSLLTIDRYKRLKLEVFFSNDVYLIDWLIDWLIWVSRRIGNIQSIYRRHVSIWRKNYNIQNVLQLVLTFTYDVWWNGFCPSHSAGFLFLLINKRHYMIIYHWSNAIYWFWIL